jgi:transposase
MMPGMARAPIFVRTLADDERAALMEGLRSRDAFVLRRCQILLSSANGKRASRIAAELNCDTDTVLNAIHAFNQARLEALVAGSCVAETIHRAFDAAAVERLRALLHQSSRTFGKQTSLWTLGLAAEVSFEQGLAPQQVSREAVCTALQRLGVGWKRAKQWITSHDPEYVRRKTTGGPADRPGAASSRVCSGLPG